MADPLSVADFTADVTSGTAPLTVQFTDTSTNTPTAWAWTFGDGNTSTDQNPSHTYAAAGTYTVALTSTNAYGSDAETKTGLITVLPVVDGRVKAWGGFYYNMRAVPDRLVAKKIAVGYIHGLAIRPDGTVVSWGRNDYGQCNVPEGLVAVSVDGGYKHSLAIRPDGSVVAWGTDSSGQCTVPDGLVATQVAANSEHSLALRQDGSVVAWGRNNYGQCNVPGGLIATEVDAGWDSSVALRQDGTVVAWGRNDYGQRYVPGGLIATQVAAGGYHNLALRPDGTVVAWGRNDYGQCNVPEGLIATKVVCGIYHSLAYCPDGSIVGWGKNDRGQCNIPYGINEIQQVDAGWDFTVAIDPTPIASFAVSQTTGVVPLTVAFEDTSYPNITNWMWDFGDGETSTEQNPSHTYRTTGRHTVTLTVSNDWGESTAVLTDYIRVAKQNPIYVQTYEDLCNVGSWNEGWGSESEYIQTADIQCPTGVSFTPIGEDDPFTGSYDGRGYVIRDLYINRPDDDDVGLFGKVEGGAVITNVMLENILISGGDYSGGLLGEGKSYGGTISITNCTVTGTFDLGDYTGSQLGGLAGIVGNGVITNCSTDVEIRGDMLCYVGGLIGEAYDCIISSCSASGDILYSDEYGGGLIGFGDELILIDCHATGDVGVDPNARWQDGPTGGLVAFLSGGSLTNCSATGVVQGGDDATGGLIGDLNGWYGGAVASVSRCYATGNVSGLDYTGGLIGTVGVGPASVIEDCYATGAVFTSAASDPDYGYFYGSAGGLIGRWYQRYGACPIQTSYAAGPVAAPNLSSTEPYTGYGGFVGLIDPDAGGVCTNCFWNTETSGQATSAGGATGKTTAEMQTLTTYVGWDIAAAADYVAETWYIVPGEDYPGLAWEGVPAPSVTSVTGYVYSVLPTAKYGTSTPISGASVSCNGISATTGADGSFTLALTEAYPAGTQLLITAAADEHQLTTKPVICTGGPLTTTLRLWGVRRYGTS